MYSHPSSAIKLQNSKKFEWAESPLFFCHKDPILTLMTSETNPTSATTAGSKAGSKKEILEQLISKVEPIIAPMGYEVVALEESGNPKERALTLYIDFLPETDTAVDAQTKRIGLDDCIKVNDAVDSLFETTDLINFTFSLEVSSPGVERPLRKLQDYLRFANRKIKIHTFRPLEAQEIENTTYLEKNPKQKNFIGILKGLTEDHQKVTLQVDTNLIQIPFLMITKANLLFTEGDVK